MKGKDDALAWMQFVVAAERLKHQNTRIHLKQRPDGGCDLIVQGAKEEPSVDALDESLIWLIAESNPTAIHHFETLVQGRAFDADVYVCPNDRCDGFIKAESVIRKDSVACPSCGQTAHVHVDDKSRLFKDPKA
jgi:hypothetical protein